MSLKPYMVYPYKGTGTKALFRRGLQSMKTQEIKRPEAKKSEQAEAREFYTVAQLADVLQLNGMTIYRMVKTGDLPCYMLGRIMRFRRDDIEAFLEQHRVPPRKRRM
jgi:excisionase family DNA binding protein